MSPACAFLLRFGPVVFLLGSGGCASQRSPLLPGVHAIDHGAIGATEGPAWHEGFLYFTGAKAIGRFGPDGHSTLFRAASEAGGPNGLAFDLEGRLLTCESAARRVTRTELDGTITVLADRHEGARFNSPNDLTLDSRGRIYFTDPRYGSRDGMEMIGPDGRPIEGVYRIDAPGMVRRLTLPGVDRPNGIIVGPGDRSLYLCDNNNNTVGGARRLVRFDLRPDGEVDPASRRILFDWSPGRGPDGIKRDRDGRLYVAAGLNRPSHYETTDFKTGCYILSPTGRQLAFVPTLPDAAANCAFGGLDGRTLFITSGGHLWSVRLNAEGRR